MTKKACKHCKKIYEGSTCPSCGSGSEDSVDNWKGRVIILDPENSEIAKKMKISKKGEHAVKTK